jgi:hypothetical protein
MDQTNREHAKVTFREVTYLAEDGETYVTEDIGTGKVTDVYTYQDSKLVEETAGSITWTPGQNPLFVHADKPQDALDYMERHRWIRTDD